MSKPTPLVTKLLKAKNEESGTVTYKFADGTFQTQPLRKEFFYDAKGKAKDLYVVVQDLNDICHDKHAVSYDVD